MWKNSKGRRSHVWKNVKTISGRPVTQTLVMKKNKFSCTPRAVNQALENLTKKITTARTDLHNTWRKYFFSSVFDQRSRSKQIQLIPYVYDVNYCTFHSCTLYFASPHSFTVNLCVIFIYKQTVRQKKNVACGGHNFSKYCSWIGRFRGVKGQMFLSFVGGHPSYHQCIPGIGTWI